MGKVTKKKEKVNDVPAVPVQNSNFGKYKPIPRFGGCKGC